MEGYDFDQFDSLNELVEYLIDPENAPVGDPDHERFDRFETILDRFYEPALTFSGQLCSINMSFNSRGDHTTDDADVGNEAIYLNFADYAAEAFEFVSYVAGYQVNDFLNHMASKPDIYGVKMSLTFHAIFYHINSDGSVDYRTEVYDQMAQNERGQNMVILDASACF